MGKTELQPATQDIKAGRRTLMQAARLAVQDVYDAIVELVTNADDRYQVLGTEGRIDICVERKRRGAVQVLKVRDFADGMSADTMAHKLSQVGGRVSGMERGLEVRGTNSRGAKDVAALGDVTFESIAADGQYHRCRITRFFEFERPTSEDVTKEHRVALGLPKGTGTVVTIEVEPRHAIQNHETLKKRIGSLVQLRGVLGDPRRTVMLHDLNQDRKDPIHGVHQEGKERVKESFLIPGYEEATAKLVIQRAPKPFEREHARFRHGGILVQSKHACHEATLFDAALESDQHAAWFFGKLTCPAIDDLGNEYDERFERRQSPDPKNPLPIVDPSRRSGLTREHPFVQALCGEVLKRLRRLVEEERKRAESERSRVENDATRRRLNALERAATKFIEDAEVDEEPARDPNDDQMGGGFKAKGFSLNPPFAQMIKGHSQRFWLNISREAFPEIETGAVVQVECLSAEISTDHRIVGLEAHPERESVLRAVWMIKAGAATPASGIRARVGPIVAESAVEVLNNEAERYSYVKGLEFERDRYLVRAGVKKKMRLLAPLALVPVETHAAVATSSKGLETRGEVVLYPEMRFGVAIGEVFVLASGKEDSGEVSANLAQDTAKTEVKVASEKGVSFKIKIEDIDLGNQRYSLKNNVLEIAARHPSVSRYLGKKEDGFPGQNLPQFRLLVAEIVAEALCAHIVRKREAIGPEEFEGADWDRYYSLYTSLVTKFLPIAHKLQCPEVD